MHLLLVLIFVLPSSVLANIYMCSIDGKLVSQSKPCQVAKPNIVKKSSIGFDGWKLGEDIDSMKEKSKERKLTISPDRMGYLPKYNVKKLNSNPDSREYIYRTKIMNTSATVHLLFTKKTKKLYQIKTRFNVGFLKKEERKYFYEGLYTLLSKKYGKVQVLDKQEVIDAKKGLSGLLVGAAVGNLHGNLYVWNANTNETVTLEHKKRYETRASYTLIYESLNLSKLNKQEITASIQNKTKRSIVKDENKF